MPLNSHVFFERLLVRAGQSAGLEPKAFSSVSMVRWAFEQDRSVSFFRVHLTSVADETTLSCTIASSSRSKKGVNHLPFGLGSLATDTWVPGSVATKKPPADMPSDSDATSERPSEGSDGERSWSTHDDDPSESGSNSDSAEPVVVPEHHPPPPPPAVVEPEAEPWNCVGIKAWPIAPKSGKAAICLVCEVPIAAGGSRVDYRKKTEQATLRPKADPSRMCRQLASCHTRERHSVRRSCIGRPKARTIP